MNTEMQNPQARFEAAARIVRERSRAGKLTSLEDIFDEVVAPGEAVAEPCGQEDALRDLLRTIIEGNQDIKEVLGRDGSGQYYSSMFMTEAYAWLLLKKDADPLRVIADMVRENAAQYPRPTSIEVLRGSPFEMSQEEILACLQNLAAVEEYKDIKRLLTSAGTVFLYSTLHLEPDHASMLAEWIDVGQLENP